MVIRKDTEPKKILKAYEIFKILKDIKELHGLSYIDLGKTLEIHRSTLQRYVTGEITDVPYENIQKICKYIRDVTGQSISLNMVNTDIVEDRLILNRVTKLLKNPKKKRQMKLLIKSLEVEEY